MWPYQTTAYTCESLVFSRLYRYGGLTMGKPKMRQALLWILSGAVLTERVHIQADMDVMGETEAQLEDRAPHTTVHSAVNISYNGEAFFEDLPVKTYGEKVQTLRDTNVMGESKTPSADRGTDKNLHSAVNTSCKEEAPLEELAVKAYGEPGEKWKVLGYSPITGYPIIDLSELGIGSKTVKEKPETPSGNLVNVTKSVISEPPLKVSTTEYQKIVEENQPRPRSYSEMKGGNIQNVQRNMHLDSSGLYSHTIPPSKYYKIKHMREPDKDQNIDEVVRELHSRLHRTHSKNEMTVRSILYPEQKPPKYRIMSRTLKIQEALKFRKRLRSKGKYDVRKLDVEKLLDIIVPDAALLTFMYMRDLPSLPLIYDCKVALLDQLSRILSGFQQIEITLGKRVTGSNIFRVDWFAILGRKLVRWVLGIKSHKITAKEPATIVEQAVTMFQVDLPYWSDKDCEGEMDFDDWNQFNFNYNYLLDTAKHGFPIKSRGQKIKASLIRKSNKVINKITDDEDIDDTNDLL